MLQHALKEWAVICRALAEGRQALILRKGGIEEAADGFQLQHTRFWLYPTYVHQQERGIKADAAPLLEQAKADQPPAGILRLSHLAEATGVYVLHDIVGALLLSQFHILSDAVVQERFIYRRPGLYAIVLRVYRVPQPFEVAEEPSYAGCRSWVELDRELSAEGATPVLADAAFHELQKRIDRLLKPTAFA
jgi:hypothetical protein